MTIMKENKKCIYERYIKKILMIIRIALEMIAVILLLLTFYEPMPISEDNPGLRIIVGFLLLLFIILNAYDAVRQNKKEKATATVGTLKPDRSEKKSYYQQKIIFIQRWNLVDLVLNLKQIRK